MPKVKRSRKPPPDGWELIEPTLDELDQKMREGNQTDYLYTAQQYWSLSQPRYAVRIRPVVVFKFFTFFVKLLKKLYIITKNISENRQIIKYLALF